MGAAAPTALLPVCAVLGRLCEPSPTAPECFFFSLVWDPRLGQSMTQCTEQGTARLRSVLHLRSDVLWHRLVRDAGESSGFYVPWAGAMRGWGGETGARKFGEGERGN